MKNAAPSHTQPFYLALVLLLLVAVAVSTRTRFPSEGADMPAVQINATNPAPVPASNLAEAIANLTNAKRVYREAVIARATDPSFVVASSTYPDGDITLYVITLNTANPFEGASFIERCAEQCAYFLFDRRTSEWTEISVPTQGSGVISSVPTWLSSDNLLFTYAYGDGPMWSASFFTTDTSGSRQTIGQSTFYAFSKESIDDINTRTQTSVDFRPATEGAPSVIIFWSEERKRWIAQVYSGVDRGGSFTPITTTLLSNPPKTDFNPDAVRLDPAAMARGEADVVFSWFGKTYVLNGERLQEKK